MIVLANVAERKLKSWCKVMSTGAKDIHRLRDWDDDDYSEGFSEYLSE